jgi:Flp pilus assembly protein TadG
MKGSIKYGLRLLLRVRPPRSVRAGREEGQSLVEFALVLPLLSMLLLGIIWGGITFYEHVTLANAAATGARTLAINAGTTSACYSAQQSLLAAAYNLNASEITVEFLNTTVSGTYSTSDSPAMTCTVAQGSSQSVQATYPCSFTIPFLGINLCPMKGTGAGTACPYPYCITSTATVPME